MVAAVSSSLVVAAVDRGGKNLKYEFTIAV